MHGSNLAEFNKRRLMNFAANGYEPVKSTVCAAGDELYGETAQKRQLCRLLR